MENWKKLDKEQKNKKKNLSCFQSKAYLATLGFVIFLTFAMALSALVVGPIALEKADDAYDDVNGDYETFTSRVYQSSTLINNNMTIRLKTIGDMHYATLSIYSASNVNASAGQFLTTETIPSRFIPRTPSGGYTDGTIQTVYYRADSTPPTVTTDTGIWLLLANGTIRFQISPTGQYIRIAPSTLVYPKVM